MTATKFEKIMHKDSASREQYKKNLFFFIAEAPPGERRTGRACRRQGNRRKQLKNIKSDTGCHSLILGVTK
jgi:hypothetical protein